MTFRFDLVSLVKAAAAASAGGLGQLPKLDKLAIVNLDQGGVVEVLYLGAGVVRRDGAGRVVNTALRHDRDQPPKGTRFMAGELFAGVISTAPTR